MDTQNSILDKVIAASNEQELAAFNPMEAVVQLFADLGSREQDILRRRFGLSGKESETLEEIGQGYNVTRERVRQIENAAIKHIKSKEIFTAALKPVEFVVLTTLEKHGGIMAEDHLLEYVLQQKEVNQEVASRHLLFLLTKLGGSRLVREQVPGHRPSWRVDFVNWDKVRETIACLQEILEAASEPMSEEDLLSKFKETEVYRGHKEHFKMNDVDENSMDFVYAHLRTSEKIKQNPFGEWGLDHWSTVTPKRMGDKIYLIMKKRGEPLHFRDIAEAINAAGFDSKRAYPPTVHNELILDERYVLVGRGIYALREWGYVPGVVSDVIANVLDSAGAPMTRDEIVEAVLKQRMVKKGTVYLALSNTAKFAKDDSGRFSLIK